MALIVGLLLSTILATRVSRPLARAGEVLEAMGRGEFGERLPVHSDDEIGRLSATVNEMAAKLQRRQVSLDREVGLHTSHREEVSHLHYGNSRSLRRIGRHNSLLKQKYG